MWGNFKFGSRNWCLIKSTVYLYNFNLYSMEFLFDFLYRFAYDTILRCLIIAKRNNKLIFIAISLILTMLIQKCEISEC